MGKERIGSKKKRENFILYLSPFLGQVAKLNGVCEYSYKSEEEMKIIRANYNSPDSTERAKIIKRETKAGTMGGALASLGHKPKFPIGKIFLFF